MHVFVCIYCTCVQAYICLYVYSINSILHIIHNGRKKISFSSSLSVCLCLSPPLSGSLSLSVCLCDKHTLPHPLSLSLFYVPLSVSYAFASSYDSFQLLFSSYETKSLVKCMEFIVSSCFN